MSYPEIVQNIIDNTGDTYSECKQAIMDLNRNGWTAEMDLSGELYHVRPMFVKVEIPYVENEDTGELSISLKALEEIIEEEIKKVKRIL
jgi:hypothetical protein